MFILHRSGQKVTHKTQSYLPDASKCINFFEVNSDLVPSSQLTFCSSDTRHTPQIPTAYMKASQRMN